MIEPEHESAAGCRHAVPDGLRRRSRVTPRSRPSSLEDWTAPLVSAARDRRLLACPRGRGHSHAGPHGGEHLPESKGPGERRLAPSIADSPVRMPPAEAVYFLAPNRALRGQAPGARTARTRSPPTGSTPRPLARISRRGELVPPLPFDALSRSSPRSLPLRRSWQRPLRRTRSSRTAAPPSSSSVKTPMASLPARSVTT